MKKLNYIFVTLLMIGALTGCGAMTTGERTVTGAGVGAAADAGITAIAGGNPWVGAGVGAAAGALTGYVTSEDKKFK